LIPEYLRETAQDKTVWGVNDCALWASDLILKATGVDVAKDLRGTYSSWFECRQVLMQYGGLTGLCRDRLDFLQRGESQNGIGLIKTSSHHIVGILCSSKFHMRPVTGCSGLVMVSDFNLVEGWTWL
jgi:uncharacterized protein DUF6950